MSVDRIIEAQKRKLEMWKLAEKQEQLDDEPADAFPEEFTCPICYEEMSGPEHRPMICIPCGHTICNTCMASAIKVKPDKCPFCGGPVKAPPAVNYALQNAIEKHVKNGPVGSTLGYAEQLEAVKGRLACLVDKYYANKTRSEAVKKELATEKMVLDAITEEMNKIIEQHREQEAHVNKLREEDAFLDQEIARLKEVIDPIMIEKKKLDLLVEGTQGNRT